MSLSICKYRPKAKDEVRNEILLKGITFSREGGRKGSSGEKETQRGWRELEGDRGKPK